MIKRTDEQNDNRFLGFIVVAASLIGAAVTMQYKTAESQPNGSVVSAPLIQTREVTAVELIITACADPSSFIGADNRCPDGSAPRTTKMQILSRTDEGDAVIRLARDGNVLLTVTPEGGATSAPGFELSEGALMFWKVIASVYRDACPDLSTVLQSVYPGNQPSQQETLK